ncbi:hypothetical protein V6N13_098619 [Hibiscus sabdariffa]
MTATASTLKDLLKCYVDCSGQLVNFNNSNVFFTTNVSMESRLDVSYIDELDLIAPSMIHPITHGNDPWKPPLAHLVKINTDACFLSVEHKSCSVIVEYDSKYVINKISSNSFYHSEIGFITHDIKMVAKLFACCKFNPIGRNNNKAAQAMMTERSCYLFDRLWIEDAPSRVLFVRTRIRDFIPLYEDVLTLCFLMRFYLHCALLHSLGFFFYLTSSCLCFIGGSPDGCIPPYALVFFTLIMFLSDYFLCIIVFVLRFAKLFL